MPFFASLMLAAALTLADAAQAEPAVIEQRVKVDITGSVRRPGLYALPLGARIVDAIQAAGGPAPNAALNQVELADRLQDGESLEIPARPTLSSQIHQSRAHLRAGLRSGPGYRTRAHLEHVSRNVASHMTHGGKIDLNSASADDLEQLPGVGPALASRILAYRSAHGRFHSTQELEEVRGIGAGRMARIGPYVEAR